jgi:hypothetical protein
VSAGNKNRFHFLNHSLIERAAQTMSKASKKWRRDKTDLRVVNHSLIERIAQAMSKESKK